MRGCAAGHFECLIQIGEDVADILDANRQPHHLGRDARGSLLLRAQLLVRGRGRMDDERLGVADVGQQARRA